MGFLSTNNFIGLDLGQRQDPTALVAGVRRQLILRWNPVTLTTPRPAQTEDSAPSQPA